VSIRVYMNDKAEQEGIKKWIVKNTTFEETAKAEM
jgi:hypothetical protein